MGAMHRPDGALDERERSPQEERDALSATLEAHIAQIEVSFVQRDTNAWEESVGALRDAASSAGANRIMTTTSLLLDAETADVHAVRELLDRLRSEGRVFTLEQNCQRKEKALADELQAMTPVMERDRV